MPDDDRPSQNAVGDTSPTADGNVTPVRPFSYAVRIPEPSAVNPIRSKVLDTPIDELLAGFPPPTNTNLYAPGVPQRPVNGSTFDDPRIEAMYDTPADGSPVEADHCTRRRISQNSENPRDVYDLVRERY